MNKLSKEEQVRVVACLVEGNSLRSIVRMPGIYRTTIQKLLVELGAACSAYQDKVFRNLKCKRVQCDEIWSFVFAKDKNVPEDMKGSGAGSVWTWVALDRTRNLSLAGLSAAVTLARQIILCTIWPDGWRIASS